MFDEHSRYRDQPTREWVTRDGRRVVHVVPRPTPPPEASTPGARIVATDSDRLDTLAHRHLGTPAAWWLLADANRVMHPDELLDEPGRSVVVPVPGPRGPQP